jgi:hypothetical protein
MNKFSPLAAARKAATLLSHNPDAFVCKPALWSDVARATVVRSAVADAPMVDALVAFGTSSPNPYDNFTAEFAQRELPAFVLFRHGARYLVVTEGYAYARYIAKLA